MANSSMTADGSLVDLVDGHRGRVGVAQVGLGDGEAAQPQRDRSTMPGAPAQGDLLAEPTLGGHRIAADERDAAELER